MRETLREALVQACRDLLLQGAYGYDPQQRSCEYLTPAGHNCVIGKLLKRYCPEVPLHNLFGSVCTLMQGNTRTALEVHFPDLTPDEQNTMRDLQSLHDFAAEARGGFLGSYVRASHVLVSWDVKAIWLEALAGHLDPLPSQSPAEVRNGPQ